MHSPSLKLSLLSLRAFMEAPLHRYVGLSHWPLVLNSIPASLSPPQRSEMGWRFRFSNPLVASFGNPPHPELLVRAHQELPHQHILSCGWKGLVINNERCSSHSYHSGNQGVWSSMPGTGEEDQICICYIKISPLPFKLHLLMLLKQHPSSDLCSICLLLEFSAPKYAHGSFLFSAPSSSCLVVILRETYLDPAI